MTILQETPQQLRVIGEARLLAGLDSGRADLARHLWTHGEQPQLTREAYTTLTEEAGLKGRGGAGFPVALKLADLPAKGIEAVVVNGSESEPVSRKDRLLLALAPHLVLDGATGLARALGAPRVVIAVHDATAAASLRAAVAERTTDEAEHRYRSDGVDIQIADTPAASSPERPERSSASSTAAQRSHPDGVRCRPVKASTAARPSSRTSRPSPSSPYSPDSAPASSAPPASAANPARNFSRSPVPSSGPAYWRRPPASRSTPSSSTSVRRPVRSSSAAITAPGCRRPTASPSLAHRSQPASSWRSARPPVRSAKYTASHGGSRASRPASAAPACSDSAHWSTTSPGSSKATPPAGRTRNATSGWSPVEAPAHTPTARRASWPRPWRSSATTWTDT